jgi:hypothetical protein
VAGGGTGGSGGVAVVAFDSWDQRGHFGTKFVVWLSILAGWQWV